MILFVAEGNRIHYKTLVMNAGCSQMTNPTC